MRTLTFYLIAISVVTFLAFGIDKWKARTGRWRISEATLLSLALIGGAAGAWIGMTVFHHKTLHKKFKYGVPVILLLQIILLALGACRTPEAPDTTHSSPQETKPMKISKLRERIDPEHSPNTLIIMYDETVGMGPLLEAIKAINAQLIYDYGKVHGIAIRKPEDKTLDETITYFKNIKGVTHVERDRIIRLTDPIRKSPRNKTKMENIP